MREPSWRLEFESAIAGRVSKITPVSGGESGQSYRVTLASGSSVFLKDYPAPAQTEDSSTSRQAACEARGLEWLSEANALRVPKILALGANWLALEWIESRTPQPDFDAQLGRGLAELHAHGADTFGFHEPNWIGGLPQDNTTHESWCTFYRERRLRPLIQHAQAAGRIDSRTSARLGAIEARLSEWIGIETRPARLHGDLWSGNVITDELGAPCLIDPAVYCGDGEVDLAMMRLFGGFGPAVFAHYEDVSPLAPGHARRVSLYQLYPVLVHVCLFGSAYASRLSDLLDHLLSSPVKT